MVQRGITYVNSILMAMVLEKNVLQARKITRYAFGHLVYLQEHGWGQLFYGITQRTQARESKASHALKNKVPI